MIGLAENSGGTPLYQLKITQIDPDAPDHEHLKEWIGGKWDAACFDLKAANAALKKLKL